MIAKLGLILDIIGVFLLAIDMLKVETQININNWIKYSSSIKIKTIIFSKDLTEEEVKYVWNLFILNFIFIITIYTILDMAGFIDKSTETNITNFLNYSVITIFIYFGIIALLMVISKFSHSLFNICLKLSAFLLKPLGSILIILIPLLSITMKLIITPFSYLQDKYCEEKQLPRIIGLILLLVGFICQYMAISA